MKILELIQRTTEFFAKHGIEQPRLQIELLLAHALKRKRLELYLDFERELDEKTLTRLREMVRRRADGEPLQYIVGSVNFYGLELGVDKRALIPRPETEILVEAVLEKLKTQAGTPTLAGKPVPPIQVLDLCTGSGCIAIALAKNLPNARIVATDASTVALMLAKENLQKHELDDQIELQQSDLFEDLPSGTKYHTIISNPPYIAEADFATLVREIREHEPRSALLAGKTGLEVIERIICDAPRFMLSSGILALEIGAGQHEKVADLVKQANFVEIEVVTDLAGIERVVLGRIES